MTKFVAITAPRNTTTSDKYVKQTYDALSNVNLNLESIAVQIAQLPIREQHRYLRLIINYIEQVALNKNMHYPPVGLDKAIELCDRIMQTVNEYYEEQDKLIMEGR
jgi:hypothetical protein